VCVAIATDWECGCRTVRACAWERVGQGDDTGMGKEPTRGKRVVVGFGWKGCLVVSVRGSGTYIVAVLVLLGGRLFISSVIQILEWCSSLGGYVSFISKLILGW